MLLSGYLTTQQLNLTKNQDIMPPTLFSPYIVIHTISTNQNHSAGEGRVLKKKCQSEPYKNWHNTNTCKNPLKRNVVIIKVIN